MSKFRYNGFPTFFLTGLLKYGLLVIGVGIIVILSFLLIKEKYFQNSDKKRNIKTNESVENRTENLNLEKQQTNRNLRLAVAHDLGQDLKTITKKVTPEIIRSTMNSINWNEFHIVQLEEENDNALHVSGSLSDDGLASGFVTENDHIVLVKPIETVDQMTEILLNFVKGENIWRNNYEYK